MLEEMMERAQGTKCENPFYQMNINPAPGEHLTEQDWDRAREIAEKKHGLEGQPYFMVMHVKHGREHPHFIYSRIDIDNMRAISDSHDARKNHAIAPRDRAGVRIAKNHRPLRPGTGNAAPGARPKKYEMYRDKRNGLDTRDIQAEVTELFQQSHNGKDFQAALEQHGYHLVTGRRGLLILDSAGKEHSLARRCGVPMSEIVAFMRDVHMKAVPTVEQARAQYQERKIAGLEADRDTVRDEIHWQEALDKAAIAKEARERQFVEPKDREKETRGGRQEKGQGARAERPFDETIAGIRLAYSLSQSPDGFSRNLDEAGFKLARVTKEESERSHINAAFAKEVERFTPEYREGEFVAINQRGHVYRLNQRTTSKSWQEIDAFMRTIDSTKIQGIDDIRQQIMGYKRPAPARDVFPTEAQVTGGIPMQEHLGPLTAWQQFGRASSATTERDRAPDEIRGPSADIWTAYKRSDNARAFVAALHERNIEVAQVTREDVTSSEIHRFYAADLNTPRNAIPPKLREGDYVAITDDACIYNLNYRTTGDNAARVQKFMETLDRKEIQSVGVVLKAVQERAELRDIERQAFRDLSAGEMKREKDGRPTGRLPRTSVTGDIKHGLHKSVAAIEKTASIAASFGKVFETVGNLVEAFAAPKLTPQQIHDGEKAKDRRDAEADRTIDFSRVTADEAQERRQMERDREADRQRDGGGRER